MTTTTIVLPPGRLNLPRWSEIWHAREVAVRMAQRDIIIRYRQTILGVGWVILQPLMSAGVFTLVFGRVAGFQNGVPIPFFLFSLAGTKISGAYTAAAHDPAFTAAAKAHPGQLASLQQHLSGGLNDTSFLTSLARPLSHPFYVGFSSAGDVVFAVCAVLLVAAVVLSAFLKEVPLRLVSGNQARAQAEAVQTHHESVL